MQYPYRIRKVAESEYILQLLDIPEVIASGKTLEDAKAETLDAFISFAEWLFDDGMQIPLPSSAKCETVSVPASISAKILLLNAMTQTGIRPIDIANKIGITRQEMTRITNLRRKTKIDTLEQAISATGKNLYLSIMPQV